MIAYMIIDFINHSQPQEVKEVKDIAYKTFELAAALRYRLYFNDAYDLSLYYNDTDSARRIMHFPV